MESETKRQWMQSYEGRIRVGPEYQAMIPPFCRPAFPSSQQNAPNPPQDQANHSSNREEFMQSYAEEPLDDGFDADITSHLKFAAKDEESTQDFVGETKGFEPSLNSDSESAS